MRRWWQTVACLASVVSNLILDQYSLVIPLNQVSGNPFFQRFLNPNGYGYFELAILCPVGQHAPLQRNPYRSPLLRRHVSRNHL